MYRNQFQIIQKSQKPTISNKKTTLSGTKWK